MEGWFNATLSDYQKEVNMATYTPDYTIDIVTAKFAGTVLPFFRLNVDIPNLANADKINFGDLGSNLIRFEGTIAVSGLYGSKNDGYNALSSLGFSPTIIQCDDNPDINLRTTRYDGGGYTPKFYYVNAYLRNGSDSNRNFGIGGVFTGSSYSITRFGYSPFILVYNKSVNKYITFAYNNGDVGVAFEGTVNPGFVNDNNIPVSYIYITEHYDTRIGDRTVSSQDEFDIFTPWVTDPYSDGGDSDVSVPTGDFDDTSNPIDFPSLPSLGATDTGLITLYNPSLNEVKALATYMWTNPAFDISAWKKIVADPIDAILGLSIVPVDVPDGGVRPIAVGNILTDVNMNVAAQQYIEVQCGALNVNEFWSSYLDYEPYTKAEIYLPYCGVHQLSVDDIMNKTVEVRYHIDILTGSCCAYVKCGDSVLYQFIGQCSSSIPIASGDFSEIVSSALNAALAIGSLAASGGASAPFSVPEITANAVNILKEKIQKSGSLSGTGGMLGIQKPYLILTRPRQAHPANQNHYTGYPSFITENLSELSGYTEIEQIHLENVQATDSELNEIVSLLESGVIF